jgi:hypothetical protein
MLRAVRQGSISRRSVLAGGALLLTSAMLGCTDPDQPQPTPSGSPDPDAAALRAALAREEELLAAYAAAAASAPDADTVGFAEIATRHELHRTAILAALATVGAPATESAPAAPSDATPEDLARLETEAAVAGRTAADQVTAGDLAGLLASIAAAESANAVEVSA